MVCSPTLWARISKIPDVGTGPLASPLARLLALLTPFRPARFTCMLRCAHFLAHSFISFTPMLVGKWLIRWLFFSVFFSILDHSAFGFFSYQVFIPLTLIRFLVNDEKGRYLGRLASSCSYSIVLALRLLIVGCMKTINLGITTTL